MKSIFVFDFDNTLVNIDTSVSFIYFLSRNYYDKFLTLFNFLLSFVRKNSFNEYSRKIINRYSKSELEKKADIFLKLLEEKNRINMEIYKKMKENFSRSVIVSNGLPLLVKRFAKKNNVEAITRRFDEYRKIDKYSAFVRRYKSVDYEVYTDNLGDIDLVRKAKKSTIVVDTFKLKIRWEDMLGNIVNKVVFYLPKDSQSTINIRNYIFTYIPSLYYLFSRGGNFNWLNIFIKEILPVFLLSGIITLSNFVNILFLYAIVISIYEVGIINNDVFAVKNEDRPTQRLDKNVKYDLTVFYSLRAFLFLIFLVTAQLSVSVKLIYVLLSFLTLLFFDIHNNIDKKNRSITFLVLRILKAGTFCYLALELEIFLYGFIIIFLLESFRSVILYTRRGYGVGFKEDILLTTFLISVLFLVLQNSLMRFYLIFVLLFYYLFSFYKLLKRFVFL